MLTYYELLGVKKHATFEQIRKAYRLNVAAYHPDVNDAPNAQGLTILMNAAWETLSDPQLRKRYDELVTATAPTIEKSNDDAAKARRASAHTEPRPQAEQQTRSSEQTSRTDSEQTDRSPGETVVVTLLGGATLPFEVIVTVTLPDSELRTYQDGPYRIAMNQDGRYVVIDGRARAVGNFARSMAIFFRACNMPGLTSYQRSRLSAGRPAVLPNT